MKIKPTTKPTANDTTRMIVRVAAPEYPPLGSLLVRIIHVRIAVF